MKSQPSALRTEERKQQTRPVYLYHFVAGTVHIWMAAHDQSIAVTGGPADMGWNNTSQTFVAQQVSHDRPEQSTDANPKEVSVSLISSVPELRRYFFTTPTERVTVEIFRVNKSSLPGSVAYATDLYMEFEGVMRTIMFDDMVIRAPFVSYFAEQDGNIPRFYYQKVCNHNLYDRFCGVDPDDYYADIVVEAVSRANRTMDIIDTAFTVGSPSRSETITREMMEGGYLIDEDNQKIGIIAAEILPLFAGVRLWLAWMPSTVVVAAEMRLQLGCQKIVKACRFFRAEPNFGGTPYIPTSNPATDGL